MSARRRFPTYLLMFALAAGAGIWIWQVAGPRSTDSGRAVFVKVPQLSALAIAGREAFDASCAACHGPDAAGNDKGPPLIHNIYNPSHHADEAFVLAVTLGVRRHHWRYGDMPPQPQVTRAQLQAIVRYVRELQAANGIIGRARRM